MSEPIVFIVAAGEESRLDLFLSRQTGRSRVAVQEAIAAGFVRVNGSPATKPAHRLKADDSIQCELSEVEKPLELSPIQGELDILFEDDAIIVVNKAQGVVVHPAPSSKKATLTHHILYHLKNSTEFLATSSVRPGIVHRLDRGTSGTIVVAKNRKALEELSRQFKAREVKKTYEAIAWGVIKESGAYRSSIGRDSRDRKRMSSKSPTGKDAVTRFARMSHNGIFSHVELYPHTGRTHQLRVHLSEAQHPIVGDDLYGVGSGKRRALGLDTEWQREVQAVTQTFLHAKSLELSHPLTGERLTFEAPRPANFEHFLSLMKRTTGGRTTR